VETSQDYQSNLAASVSLVLIFVFLVRFFQILWTKHWDFNEGHCSLAGDFTDQYSLGVN